MQKYAIVFPGQGSQSIKMLEDLKKDNIIRDTFSEASEILNYDLWKLIQYGPSTELNKTWKTQPALLTSSVALWRTLMRRVKNTPNFLAGHSLGEYSALVCAKSLDFSTAIKLVEIRGKLMQQSILDKCSAMYAILGLNSSTIFSFCRKVGEKMVSIASFNSYSQTVISGYKNSVIAVSNLCKEAGAKKIVPLPISIPSHCDLMRPISKKFSIFLHNIKFRAPKTPIINNVDVKIENDPFFIRKALIRQLYCPIRWVETIELLVKNHVTTILELGPGRVLTNLSKRMINTLSCIAVNNLQSLIKAINKLNKIGVKHDFEK